MKRKNNSYSLIFLLLLFQILANSCQSLDHSFFDMISEKEIKEFCKRESIWVSDVFAYFGENVGGGDTLNGLYDGVVYIFEYKEPNMTNPFIQESYDYAKIPILNIYCIKGDDSVYLIWSNMNSTAHIRLIITWLC